MAEIDVETAHILRRKSAIHRLLEHPPDPSDCGVHAVIFVVSIRSADQVTSSSLEINWLAGCRRLFYCFDDPDIF
jgi:hypothetical protein